MATALCSCTFPSHCLLLSFLFPSPFFRSFPPPSGPALPGHSSRRVHFERINTVPIKGQRAARRSTRRHHSLSRTLLRYGRKSLTTASVWSQICVPTYLLWTDNCMFSLNLKTLIFMHFDIRGTRIVDSKWTAFAPVCHCHKRFFSNESEGDLKPEAFSRYIFLFI